MGVTSSILGGGEAKDIAGGYERDTEIQDSRANSAVRLQAASFAATATFTELPDAVSPAHGV